MILNITNTKIAFLLFFKHKFITFSKHLRINLNAEINNFQFFFISEHTQIILSKTTYIDIIIIYVSAMPCLQIQCF